MEWAAPDVAAAGGPPGARPPEEVAAPAVAAPALPRLAPMTIPDILDGGFAIMRRAPATVIGLTAVFVVPIQAAGAWFNRGVDGVTLDDVVGGSDTSFEVGFAVDVDSTASAILVLGPMIALVFVAAALARLVSAWHVGRDLTLGELLRGSLPRAWALLASWVLVHVLEAVSIVGLGLLPFAVMTWFLVTAPVIGAERLGPIAAMQRSARLVSRRFWPVLGLALLSFLVESLFDSAIGLLPSFLSAFVGTEGIAWVLPAVAGILTLLVTMPVVAGITVLIYLDLRVRTEGLDLELDALEAFPSRA